ncbi:MAG: histone-lysine N-methyltransferase [Desulfohalobiaceae bacterium]|nr:histone-lysine N-methyltransferase [Desulfohalobiaceae bacterium]
MAQHSLYLKQPEKEQQINNPESPQLYRSIYPFKKVGRVSFDDVFIMPRPADPMVITDTTFRDGQQARPPYTAEQISTIYDYLHHLGGQSGLIRQSEFFLYSEKDRKAVEYCLAKDYSFPEVTGWIRCNRQDLDLVKEMGLKETGMLTSVSDYHIYLKLEKDRQQILKDYLEVVERALELGIRPRCHFEDVTRADIYGFCIPFAQKLMHMAEESGIPVKIRLCDTMGFGVPYPGASLPRNVSKIIRAFTDEAGVPGDWLEWHGHNDFYKALINASTAWLYGCSAANGTLLGFGERTGNTPIEALVMEYISISGNDDAAYTPVITEIAEYFEKELHYKIPPNSPFVGRDFNATSAGIHVDGLSKDEEIYNIFDTKHILHKPVPIIITDKSGRSGVAYWINQALELDKENQVSKSHPAVGKIHRRIMQQYESGRNTSMSHEEMRALVKRYLPEYFISEFDHLKQTAHKFASRLIHQMSIDLKGIEDEDVIQEKMSQLIEEYPFIQYVYLTDSRGRLFTWQISYPEDKPKFQHIYIGQDLSNREWFQVPIQTGKLHVTDFYRSMFTQKLCLTVSAPVLDHNEEIVAILGADVRFEELIKLNEELEEEESLEDKEEAN